MQILVIGIIVFIKKNPLCGMVTADCVVWWFSLRWHLELFWADEQKCHLSAWWSVRLLNRNAINCHFFKTKRKPFNYFNNFASYWAEIRVYTLLNRRSLDTSYRPFPAWLCLFRRGDPLAATMHLCWWLLPLIPQEAHTEENRETKGRDGLCTWQRNTGNEKPEIKLFTSFISLHRCLLDI